MPLFVRPKDSTPPDSSRACGPIQPGRSIPPPGPIRLSFHRGIGDCVNFAQVLQLYRKRGYECVVQCTPDNRFVFEAAGIACDLDGAGHFEDVPWYEALPAFRNAPNPKDKKKEAAAHRHEGTQAQPNDVERIWQYNQIARNISAAPLPMIGKPRDLWNELCSANIDCKASFRDDDIAWANSFLEDLPRPVFLLHTQGKTHRRWKSLPSDTTLGLYRELLDRTDGSIVALNSDNSMPELANWRFRDTKHYADALTVRRLAALIDQVDVIAAVDSGPLALTRFTRTPGVALFPSFEHFPPAFCLPRRQQLHLTPDSGRAWNAQVRMLYNIVECKGPELSAKSIADNCIDMLDAPRYLERGKNAADVQLRQLTQALRGTTPTPSKVVADRHVSVDILLRQIAARFDCPRIIEARVNRKPEDWSCDPFGSYVIAAFLKRHGGHLTTIEETDDICRITQDVNRELSSVNTVHASPLTTIQRTIHPIDVLIVNPTKARTGIDADLALREVIAAMPRLHSDSVIVLDDTMWDRGGFTGLGRRAVPWLLCRGWKMLYSGYQTICVRERGS